MLRTLLLLLLVSMAVPLQARTVLHRPVELKVAGGTLYGSLLLPKSATPVPVALLIAGSGPTDRNGNNPAGRNDSLRRLAQALAQRGIASVRYDKRGVAASLAAAPDERTLSVEGYVADAIAWGHMLGKDPRFSRLVLVGHSEGALIASLAAAQAGAAALVSIAGSGRPVDQVLLEQLGSRLPPPLLAYSTALIEELKAGRTHERIPKSLDALFRPSVQPYLISLFRQDPAAAFARLRIPALIVQGRHDIQVGIEDALALKAAKPDAELELIDGMNHVLRIVPADTRRQLASYDDPELPLASALPRVIGDFIQRSGQPQPPGTD